MSFPSINQNRTLGRGRVYFSLFHPNTQDPSGYRYIGQTQEFNLTIETEDLEHFNADEGIREKDDSVPLEVNRTGNLTTDSIQPENIAQFFFGSREAFSVVGGLVEDEAIVVKRGHAYQLGETDSNLVGNRKVSNVVVNGDASVAASATLTFDENEPGDPADEITIGTRVYTLVSAVAAEDDVLIGATPEATIFNLVQAINGGPGDGLLYHGDTEPHADVTASGATALTMVVTAKVRGIAGNAIAIAEDGDHLAWSGAGFLANGSDASAGIAAEGNWEIDEDTGMLTILWDAADIADDATIEVTYDVASGTRERILSGSQPVEGAMRFVSRNAKGHQFHYTFPWVKLTPNGDYALKGDEWQSIPFNLEVLKRDGEIGAIYVDGEVFAR